jgi:GIY-YIG catalytic domain
VSECTAVYRLYDADDVLLYVGIGRRPENRWKRHVRSKRWWPQVARKHVEWHSDRPAALLAEAVAIHDEKPLYNIAVPPLTGSARGTRVRAEVPAIARCDAATGQYRQLRMSDDLWNRLGDALKRADPDSNRSAVLRKFARWYVGDIDDMPQRPSRRSPGT